MCGPHFCSMKITEDVRKYAAEQGIAEEEASHRRPPYTAAGACHKKQQRTTLARMTPRVLSLLASLALVGGTALADDPVWKSGTHHLTFDGRERTFILDVPPGLKPGAPLVMVFHGFTGSAKDVRELSGFAKVSEQHGFVAVYPDGTRDSKGKSFFNVGYEFHRDQPVDDVRFTRQLAARLTLDLGLDPRAVFATGFSNGGDLSFLLGTQREPFVAAIAPVAGTMMQSWAKGFRPVNAISVLAVNTRDDKTTLWDGDMNNRDGWGAYLSTEAVMDLWVKGLALERSERRNPSKTIQLSLWSTETDPTEARLYAFEVGGHPGFRHELS